jgi:uncharacterized membrane protein SirB2
MCTCVCLCVRACVYMCVWCVCVRVRVYIHTHAHNSLRRTAVISTHYSTALFFGRFFILRANQALISSVGVLTSNCAALCYILAAQLFLQPRRLPHRETHTAAFMTAVSSASAPISWRSLNPNQNHDSRNVTHSLTHAGRK